jgi:hypothetical protein
MLYARNLTAFLTYLVKDQKVNLNLEDEIVRDTLLTHGGEIVQPRVREYLTKLRQDAFLEIKEGYVDSGAAPGKDTAWKDAVELKPQTTTKEEVAARHKKKILGVVPVGSGKKPASAPATPGSAAPGPGSAPATPDSSAPAKP